MAIDNVLFPNPKNIFGVKRVPMIPVGIVGNGNKEYRFRTNRFERYGWTFPSSTILEPQMKELYKFWNQRQGALKSFLFQDPQKLNFENDILSSAGGSNWYIRIAFDETTPGDHRIFNVKLSELTATRNGSPATISAAYINSEGEPVLTITGSSSTDTIRISGPCYFAARFDSTVGFTDAAFDSNNIVVISRYDDITLLEVPTETIL